MIKLFGDQNASDLEKQLLDLEESFKLKKIANEEYELKKVGGGVHIERTQTN